MNTLELKSGLRKWGAALGALGLVFAVASGCASFGRKIEKPKVQLHSIGLKKAEDQGATLLVGIKVENPNAFELRVDRLRYEAELEGRTVAAGILDKSVGVPAKGKSVVEIPVSVNYGALFGSLIDFMSRLGQNEKTTRYRVKGSVHFGLLEIPFDEQGELKLEQ